MPNLRSIIHLAMGDKSATGALFFVAFTILFLWWTLIRLLSLEWNINPQYSYGWAVPFLIVYSIFIRWKSRPQSAPAINPSLQLWFLWLLALLFFPMRLLAEANPDWRMAAWGMAMLVSSFTGLII